MSNCWPDSHTFWRDKRVGVTGGSGFLGSFVVDKLRQRGAADITFASLSAGFIPRQRDDDPSILLRAGLVQREAVLQLLADARPDLIIHLAASSHVIPALIRKFVEAKERGDDHITAWGDGSPTREFLYVEDAAEGILLAAERLNCTEPVNLGSAFEISIKDLTETIARVVGFEGEVRWDTSKLNGQPRRKLDVSRAREWFGFEDDPRRTVEWYSHNRGD